MDGHIMIVCNGLSALQTAQVQSMTKPYEANQQEIVEDAINQQICQVYEQGKEHNPKDALPLMRWLLPWLL